MRSLYLLIIIFLSASMLGCLSTPPKQTEIGFFAFQINGNHYEILSSRITDGGGGNMLLQRSDSKVVLRAFDYDQDKSIDKVIVGNLSIDEANKIYNTGLKSANLKKRFQTLAYIRVYKCPGDVRSCIVQTHFISQNESFNKFTVIDNRTGFETTFFDNNSDGVLEQSGLAQSEDYQELYEKVLKTGINKGKISSKNNIYRVKPI